MRLGSICFILFLIACQHQGQKKSNEMAALKSLLADDRKAHLTKDVDLLLSHFADTIIEVKRGMTRRMSMEENRLRFHHYFQSVEFVKWDDVADPVLTFSNDSTLAVATIQKQVIVNELESHIKDTTDFSWTAVYRKMNEQWKLLTITSTNK